MVTALLYVQSTPSIFLSVPRVPANSLTI
jgi:hypothetical protein